MAAGDSDEQIKRFLVERYGDFVTYRPPMNPRTVLLWVGPLLLVLGGGFAVWRTVRANRAADDGENE
jgi:cytochrome c-type biogenesis protein CcmH